MININKDMCTGCGICSATCPNSFVMDNDGKAKAISQEALDCAKQAADECPTGAITVE